MKSARVIHKRIFNRKTSSHDKQRRVFANTIKKLSSLAVLLIIAGGIVFFGGRLKDQSQAPEKPPQFSAEAARTFFAKIESVDVYEDSELILLVKPFYDARFYPIPDPFRTDALKDLGAILSKSSVRISFTPNRPLYFAGALMPLRPLFYEDIRIDGARITDFASWARVTIEDASSDPLAAESLVLLENAESNIGEPFYSPDILLSLSRGLAPSSSSTSFIHK